MKYFPLAIFFFIIELFIALFVHDDFIRPYLGDFLVVFVIYFLLRSFWKTRAKNVAMAVLIFSFGVEIAQYYNVVELLGLGDNKLARIIIGTTFHWKDLVAYTLGVVAVYVIDIRFLEATSVPTIKHI